MVRITIEEVDKLIETFETKRVVEEKQEVSRIEQLEKDKKREQEREKAVKSFFETITGRTMTNEEYLEYIDAFDSGKPGFNIKSYINSLNIQKQLT